MQVPITSKQPHEIQAVADFEAAKADLEAFRAANPQFFEHYDALVESYNQRREAADKAVRAEGVKCGDFDLYQQYTKYDWEKVYASVGRERFLEAGGKITNKKVLGGNNKSFELAVTRGLIPQEVLEACTTVETRYHTPPVLVAI